MSLLKLQQNIADGTRNGKLNALETQKILSTKDHPTFSGTSDQNIDSIGGFVDADEYQAIKSLHNKVQSGEIRADEGSRAMLETFVDRGGPDSRIANAAARGAFSSAAIGSFMFLAGPPLLVLGIAAGAGFAVGALTGIYDD